MEILNCEICYIKFREGLDGYKEGFKILRFSWEIIVFIIFYILTNTKFHQNHIQSQNIIICNNRPTTLATVTSQMRHHGKNTKSPNLYDKRKDNNDT